MDGFDKLIKRMSKLTAMASVGAMDPESAAKLGYAEFGTSTAAPRPVLTGVTDANKGAINRSLDRAINKVLDGQDRTGQQIMQDVGDQLAELVREEIGGESRFKKALKPSTIQGRRRRGNTDDTPLVDRSILEDGETALVDSIEVVVSSGSAVKGRT